MKKIITTIKKINKVNVKTIAIVVAIGGAVCYTLAALKNLKFATYSMADELMSMRKLLFKLQIGQKVDLHQKYGINIDEFIEKYESEAMAKLQDIENATPATTVSSMVNTAEADEVEDLICE